MSFLGDEGLRQKTLEECFGVAEQPRVPGRKKRAPKHRRSLSLKQVETDESQMVLDAGQKTFLPEFCKRCQMLYNPNNGADVKAHEKYHTCIESMQMPGLPCRCLAELVRLAIFHDGFICRIVGSTASERVREWLRAAYRVAWQELGLVGEAAVAPLHDPEVQFYVFCEIDKSITITGVLCAEPAKTAYLLLDDGSMKECPDAEVVFGVRFVWVHPKVRRKKTATRLLDIARSYFVSGVNLEKTAVAFSDLLPDGRKFAEAYMQDRILIYEREAN